MSGFLAGLGVDIHPLLSAFNVTPVPITVAFVTLVGLSLVDRFLGGEDEEPAINDDDLGSSEDDDFFEDTEEIDDLDDDEFEDETFEDEFAQDDAGSTGPATPDLEPRLDELENEVEGISSTISTVRSENEAIGESVREVEENVRKLLDIYEMVTRGVNPFVDDAEGQPFDADSFGLFDDAPSDSDEQEPPVDDEVMEADPDSFFDEAFGDDDLGEELDADSEEPVDDTVDVDQTVNGGESTAKSFDDLKAEYEQQDGDWENETDGDAAGFDFDQVQEPTSTAERDDQGEETNSDEAKEWIDNEPATEDEWQDADSEPVAVNGGEPAAEDGTKPYLTKIPDGYSAELTVLEWMDYLRNHADTAETLRAIDYYRNIGWINERVANELTEVVMGFEQNGHRSSDGDHNLSELTIDEHTHSLQYISQLDGGTIDMELITSWPTRGD